MACNQLSAITYTCLSNTGGVRAMYIALANNVTGSTQNGIGTITQIGMASGTYFEQFQFNRDTSSYDEKTMINLPNGTTYSEQTVSLAIPYREASKRNKLLVLANGQPLLNIIVLDQNGIYWFFGLANGCYLTGNDGGSGIKKSDESGYKLTFSGEEPAPANVVDPTIIANIISST